MKAVIAKYLPIPNIPVETIVPKGDYGQVEMNHAIDLFSLKNTQKNYGVFHLIRCHQIGHQRESI